MLTGVCRVPSLAAFLLPRIKFELFTALGECNEEKAANYFVQSLTPQQIPMLININGNGNGNYIVISGDLESRTLGLVVQANTVKFT